MNKKIDDIRKMKKNGVFKNYIEYIVFPYYKNLVPGTKLNFTFPITILGRMDQVKVLPYMLCMERHTGNLVLNFGFLQRWIQLKKQVGREETDFFMDTKKTKILILKK